MGKGGKPPGGAGAGVVYTTGKGTTISRKGAIARVKAGKIVRRNGKKLSASRKQKFRNM